MSRIFNSIRKRMLEEKKLKRYLQYAIGEIILVVVGILIALYINNYNQERKQEKRVVAILKETQHDLAKNIWESQELIDFYSQKDSIIYLLVHKRLQFQDYKNDSLFELRYLITSPYHMKIYTNGYNNLVKNTSDIPSEFRTLLEPLNEIYVTDKYEVDKFDNRMNLITDRFHDYLAKNADWFPNWTYEPVLNDTAIDYFLNDTYYRNASITFQTYGGSLKYEVRQFRWDAIDAYNKITELLGNEEERPDYVPHNQIELSEKDLQEYTGYYTQKRPDSLLGYSMRFNIIEKDDQLYLVSLRFKDSVPLYFKDVDTVYNTTGEIIFNKNDRGTIKGFNYNHAYGQTSSFSKSKR